MRAGDGSILYKIAAIDDARKIPRLPVHDAMLPKK